MAAMVEIEPELTATSETARVSAAETAEVAPLGVPGQLEAPAAPASRRLWRIVFGAGILGSVLAVGLLAWPLPALQGPSAITLLVLTVAAAAADVFTVDFPDRQRISAGYVFPFIGAAMLGPAAGLIVAGVGGVGATLFRPGRLRSVPFHGPRLLLAAAAATAACGLLPEGLVAGATRGGAYAVLLYAAVYTTAGWTLGRVEQSLAGAPPSYPTVDLITNLLLAPLALALGVIQVRTGDRGLELAALALGLLLILVRAYVNLATLHRALKDAYARLAEQDEQLAQALGTNREMSQVVSHDLRGPLTSIMGYTELLRTSLGKPDPDLVKQTRYVDSIEGNSRRILSLADKLLDLHRLEVGGAAELTVVQPQRLLRQLVDEVQVRADQKQIALKLTCAADMPSLRTSEWMFREIAENLISNAIKYTPEGGHVDVCLAPDGDSLRLEVADSGIGMSPEDQARLFTKFFRSDDREVRKVQGTGLGLALTRTMIERLRGEVSVWSALGEGSRFTVRLPMETA